MNSIPLIKGNTPQEINTSIIALKKALSELEAQDRLLQGTDKDVQDKIKQINELIEGINTHLGTVDSHLTAVDGQITALQPVDTVTSGNMHSVTSNAVAESFFKLLWTNPHPTGVILGGTSYDIPVAQYRFLVIEVAWASYAGIFSESFIIDVAWFRSGQIYSESLDSPRGILYRATREFTLTDTSITLETSYLTANAVYQGVRDDICIPIRIYGIK